MPRLISAGVAPIRVLSDPRQMRLVEVAGCVHRIENRQACSQEHRRITDAFNLPQGPMRDPRRSVRSGAAADWIGHLRRSMLQHGSNGKVARDDAFLPPS